MGVEISTYYIYLSFQVLELKDTARGLEIELPVNEKHEYSAQPYVK